MKGFLLALLRDKDGQYSLREITICMSFLVLLTSWIVQPLFSRSMPECMFFILGGLVVAGCLGYSLEKKSPPPSPSKNRFKKGRYHSPSKENMQKITSIAQKPIVKRALGIARSLFFALGLIVTLITSQLFKSCNDVTHKDNIVSKTMLTDKELKEQKKTVAAYSKRIAELDAQNTILEQQVIDTRTALLHSLKSNAGLQKNLRQRIRNTAILTNTEERLVNCDSLASLTGDLVVSCMEKDSLYNSLTASLTEQVALKDSTIATQELRYNYLQVNYDRNLAQQQLLINDNLGLQKQVKQHRARSKLLTAGMIILSSTITYMALQH
ncbi:hypothetical protein [Chitinophaga agri]|uniref:Uncharacterized protein n=1 Tax=Chitinophaga agri TaxID=2703787 RepID=A0A6B9ZFK4_9BACT|nr:hypothetical protein [Chitinophaga agri]QHS60836.1 hypothetical protein GWR21_14895 [Chitinophaga agri]